MARHVWRAAAVGSVLAAISAVNAQSADPDLIFRKSTTFKLLTPNDKLAVYGVDDPVVEGVACHYTAPEKGGVSGALGLAEQTSDVSLACRQYAPIKFCVKMIRLIISRNASFFSLESANNSTVRSSLTTSITVKRYSKAYGF